MSDSNELVWVRSDNWCGLYIDGEIAMQGHRVTVPGYSLGNGDLLLRTLLSANTLQTTFAVRIVEISSGYRGYFPRYLADVPGETVEGSARELTTS